MCCLCKQSCFFFFLNRVHHAYCNTGDLYMHASECCITAILKEQYLFLEQYIHLNVQRLCSKFADQPQLPVGIHFNVKTRNLVVTHNLLEPFRAWDYPSVLEQKPVRRGSPLSLTVMFLCVFPLLPTKSSSSEILPDTCIFPSLSRHLQD